MDAPYWRVEMAAVLGDGTWTTQVVNVPARPGLDPDTTAINDDMLDALLMVEAEALLWERFWNRGAEAIGDMIGACALGWDYIEEEE